jgi:23S rRNA (pseudouridine1915-N3)-methyltransferase
MKILFISVGKSHDPLLKSSIDDFSSRISRYATLEWRLLDSSRKEKDAGKKEEAEAILSAIKDGDVVISLDEHGKEMTSVDLSLFFELHMTDGTKRLVFIIGGSYGLHESVLTASNKLLSLSKMTFPHQIVRLILAEQVYRGFSISKGEKYHHQ